MCSYVHINGQRLRYKDVDFHEGNWYMKHAWSEKDQDDFIVWFVRRMSRNKRSRIVFAQLPYNKDHNYLKKVAIQFVAFHGWTIKKD